MTRSRDLANVGTVLNNIATATKTTTFSTTSSTYQDTGFTVSITKKLSSSKVIVFADLAIGAYISSAGANGMASIKIVETVNNLEKDFKCVNRVYGGNSAIATVNRIAVTFIDTNTGTGTRTYKVYLKLLTGSSAELSGFNNDDFVSDLTALEIAQ